MPSYDAGDQCTRREVASFALRWATALSPYNVQHGLPSMLNYIKEQRA